MELTRQPVNTQKSTTHHFRNFYLRAQIRYILNNIDHVVIRRVRYEIQDRLRDLVNELRNSRGRVFWPVSFAALFLCALLWIAYANRPNISIYSSPHVSFRVLDQFNDFEFRLQRVIDGVPQLPEVRHFDVKPLFEKGFTLTWLMVDERDRYWGIKRFNPYYLALRDDHGWPVIPANCTNYVDKPVACKGTPQF